MRRWIVLLLSIFLMSCSSAQKKEITLATTTSLQDSGLLEYLIPEFEKDTGIKVKVIARGTGEALEIAKRGDADILFVHSKEKEEEFIKEGYGLKRDEIMYNDFVIVGPKDDPAKVKENVSNNPLKAFELIYKSNSVFVSRGDESGTHQREKKLWREININPKWKSYIVSGLGMGQVLNIADEKGGYTLSDRATYITMKKNLSLQIVCEGHPMLKNQYSIVLLNPNKISHKKELAEEFEVWILSDKAKELINNYGIEKYGEPLFKFNGKR